ncbi:hypothetical protein M2432_005643 [Mycobacterium sp. OTB74]|jgi:hypothetical protein|nr:hypothetical protein [Mycobacterium sp. OTB74]
MERLPYIDEYSTTVAVSKDDAWSAVLQVMCGNPDEPERAPIGFMVDEAIPGQRLAVLGRDVVDDSAVRREDLRA